MYSKEPVQLDYPFIFIFLLKWYSILFNDIHKSVIVRIYRSCSYLNFFTIIICLKSLNLCTHLNLYLHNPSELLWLQITTRWVLDSFIYISSKFRLKMLAYAVLFFRENRALRKWIVALFPRYIYEYFFKSKSSSSPPKELQNFVVRTRVTGCFTYVYTVAAKSFETKLSSVFLSSVIPIFSFFFTVSFSLSLSPSIGCLLSHGIIHILCSIMRFSLQSSRRQTRVSGPRSRPGLS